MKILVTGATGFFGRYIYEYLYSKKYSVHIFKGDLCDQSTFNQESYDCIIHSAALVDKIYWDSERLFSVNVDGTVNLIKHYRKSKIIYISSTDIITKQETPYSISKMNAEKEVIENNNNLIIRLPSIFGPGDNHEKIIPLLFNKYLNKGKFKLFNNHINEYVFVSDAVKFILNNINNTGLVTMEGISVRNYELNEMIKSICTININHNQYDQYDDFYNKLGKCKDYYLK